MILIFSGNRRLEERETFCPTPATDQPEGLSHHQDSIRRFREFTNDLLFYRIKIIIVLRTLFLTPSFQEQLLRVVLTNYIKLDGYTPFCLRRIAAPGIRGFHYS